MKPGLQLHDLSINNSTLIKGLAEKGTPKLQLQHLNQLFEADASQKTVFILSLN